MIKEKSINWIGLTDITIMNNFSIIIHYNYFFIGIIKQVETLLIGFFIQYKITLFYYHYEYYWIILTFKSVNIQKFKFKSRSGSCVRLN